MSTEDTTATEVSITFTDPDIQRCPFHAYASLQRQSPVYRDPVTGCQVVTRYDDIAYVNGHPEVFSNKTTQVFGREHSPVAAEVARRYQERGFLPVHTLVSNDPPSHTQFRALVDRAFSRQTVQDLEPKITDLVHGLIDEFIDRGKADFFADFAIKLPMYVIADQLGLPREDWLRFKLWSDASIEAINPVLPPQRELEIVDILVDMQQYLHRHAMAYRRAPAPTLLSHVANAEIDGRPLADGELVNIATQLLVAGNETTTTTLASALFMLLENPSLKRRLSDEPGLIANFVEEALRLQAPVQLIYRVVVQDTELRGVPIPKGALVMLVYGAGNRDATKFEQPECVRLDRANARLHLSFGKGPHYCIGNLLARTELRIAIDLLLRRLPGMRIDPDLPYPRYAADAFSHRLEALHIAF
jgi:cytochrome P450